jgi:glycosyltransferase involved in cell wall biosynthesis
VLAFFPKIVAFARQMAAEQVDHIHAHFASHPAAAAYVIHRLTGIPYSFTAHGSDLHRDRHMLREKVADAEFVVAISQFNRRIIIDECGDEFQDKVVVIHCGVDTSALHPKESTTPANRASRPLSIACVGTLHEVKGQTFLIEACRLLKQRGIDVRLHLVGDGPDLEALRTQADKAGLKRIVTFHGRKIRQEVIDILQDADVVAAPSVPTKDGRREGIPVALMEAMSCGLAVVASRLSGIPELVQDGESGILVPYGDARALAEALAHLHQHPELCEQLGRAAREVILREFDLRANAAAIARRCGAAVPEIHEHEPAAIDPAAALRETLA